MFGAVDGLEVAPRLGRVCDIGQIGPFCPLSAKLKMTTGDCVGKMKLHPKTMRPYFTQAKIRGNKTMKKTLLIITAMLFSSSIAVAESDFERIGREVVKAVGQVASATVDFRNETDKDITVSMDSDREVHAIAAHGQATFGQAKVGEAPTFYVKRPSDGVVLYSRKVGNLGAASSLGWNGSTF